MNTILKKYAELLVHYCVEIQSGEKLYVRSSTLAEPLVKEVYRAAIKAGAHVEIDLEFEGKNRIFLTEGKEHQLQRVPPLQKLAMETFDGYIFIRAPYNLRAGANNPKENSAIRSKAMAPISKRYFERTATKELRRNLCEYPTHAGAQNAGMSLEEYQQFIFGACNLFL
ncbi:MAG: aminopeptidase, partial [Bacteroidota bacterium]